ncbi:oxalate decarboxylase [Micromonospora sp. A202]|nr:oxalate decarboxylase [Micromonospora sp. A202]
MANSDPQPRRGDQGGPPIPGRNIALERQNPDLVVPPTTDSRLVPNLKFSFSQAHTRVEKGGWTREVTARDLPIATQLAGVQFGLEPGGYREIHWHQQSEWAYMLSGSCRISAVDHEGRNFIEDVKEGDLWFFPQGVPHNIQALDEGAQFLLVFNDGAFSENNTFLLSDFFAHTPRHVLAKNFGWTIEEMENLPEREKYIFQGDVPPPLQQDRVVSPTGDIPRSFKHRMTAQTPQRFRGGTVRVTDSTNFAASVTTAAALVEVEPGGMRELHWHPTTDEWQYYISGTRSDGRLRGPGRRPDVRLPGRRRGLRAVRVRALHREHRRRTAGVPGDVPAPALRGHLGDAVDGQHAPRDHRGHDQRAEVDGRCLADHKADGGLTTVTGPRGSVPDACRRGGSLGE